MNKINTIIKQKRKELNITQKELAKQMTVSQSYISAVENEIETPSQMFIKLFCLLYSVDEGSISDLSA